MTNYAVHDGNTILNVIVADTKKTAEAVTGMQAIQTDGEPWTGWVNQNGQWVNPIQEEAHDNS